MSLYLHPESLSPDPTYGKVFRNSRTVLNACTVYPHALVAARPGSAETAAWAKQLRVSKKPGPLLIAPARNGQVNLLIDFGSELEGSLELAFRCAVRTPLYVGFGESAPEAEGVGVHSTCGAQLPRKVLRTIEPRKTNTMVFAAQGFRFIRVHLVDVTAPVTLCGIRVNAQFAFEGYRGAFSCSDSRMQRIWHTSAYTARLCSREDAFWDGIKRDRHGWYGDARICKETVDNVFFDPRPAVSMMKELQTESWVNGIPHFSFDCIAMLRQHLLFYGIHTRDLHDIFRRVQALLRWVRSSQTSRDGLLARRDNVAYQFGIGFIDWSQQPIGGTFEELSWLQFSNIEGLQNAGDVAGWLGKRRVAAGYHAEAERLRRIARRRYWDPKAGFHHTLNEARRGPWKMPHEPGLHHRLSYVEKVRLGPSGPTRQANARAVFAGMCTGDELMKAVLVRKVFANPRVQRIITPFYRYYENAARAECGDPAGALLDMRQYVGDMIYDNDASTVWESFEPYVTGRIARLSLNSWPKSLCHGWGSGMVGLTARHLLGVEPLEPGYRSVRIRAVADLPWTFEAAIPTPHGTIRAIKERAHGPVRHSLPRGIREI